MSAHQRQPERVVARPLSIPDWSGTLSRTDAITGTLTCSSTGWRMALTGTPDGRGMVHLTARFDSPVMADDAAPWTDEFGIGQLHEVRRGDPGSGYVCLWTGTIRSFDLKTWAGEMADRYGGRMALTGKTQGPGVISLRAVASVVSEPQNV